MLSSCLPIRFRPRPRSGGGVTELETTTSSCAMSAIRRRHVFEVRGYSSLLTRVVSGSFVRSDTFEVGGYDWAIRFFPAGDTTTGGVYASAFAVLLTPNAEARASCDLVLVSRHVNVLNITSQTAPALVRHVSGGSGTQRAPALGSSTFVKRSQLETPRSPFVSGDTLRIECAVTVFKFKKATSTTAATSPAAAAANVEAPPRCLSQDLVNLLETEDGADVTFKIEGEVFTAHATVLAMRSPVFKAELYGPMKEGKKTTTGHRHVSIVKDVHPDVFRALLRFIYTDTVLPGMEDDDDHGSDRNKEFLKHLLVAADRYDVQGLKFLCEKMLSGSLTIATVAEMFALADRHSCSKLQDACVEFITGSDRLADVVETKGYRHLKSVNEYLEKTALERSPYLKDDRIVIECHITVIKEPCVVVKTSCSATAAEPPRRPNLSHDLSMLLQTKVGADVSFQVQGQEFAAHTSVLAAQSPVLRELLPGHQTSDEQGGAAQGHVAVNVRDMDPGVFEALLRFIYTDSVSASMAGLDAQERNELCRSLLVAADRFDVKGLKFVCERTLMNDGLDADTVAPMLALAERHKCDALRVACVEFILASTDRLHDVVATMEYAQLKASSPAVFVDLFEKAAGLR
nr:unnamed protein product [Digitaria exilis]